MSHRALAWSCIWKPFPEYWTQKGCCLLECMRNVKMYDKGYFKSCSGTSKQHCFKYSSDIPAKLYLHQLAAIPHSNHWLNQTECFIFFLWLKFPRKHFPDIIVNFYNQEYLQHFTWQKWQKGHMSSCYSLLSKLGMQWVE